MISVGNRRAAPDLRPWYKSSVARSPKDAITIAPMGAMKLYWIPGYRAIRLWRVAGRLVQCDGLNSASQGVEMRIDLCWAGPSRDFTIRSRFPSAEKS